MEYEKRYKRVHSSREKLFSYWKEALYLKFPSQYQTPFARCFGKFQELLSTQRDTISAYRDYYYLDKASFARWPSIETIPDWFGNGFVKNGWEAEKYVDKNFVNGIYTKR